MTSECRKAFQQNKHKSSKDTLKGEQLIREKNTKSTLKLNVCNKVFKFMTSVDVACI